MTDGKIVDFPKEVEVTAEERARRLKVEVNRLAALPVCEWLYYLESGHLAEKHDIPRVVMREMIEKTIKGREKKAREDKAEDRQREQRTEKEEERQRREQERADKKAERKRKAREKEFAAIAKLPRLAHEAHLAMLAKHLGEDVDFLRTEFAAFYVPADTDTLVEPWEEPVDTQALLTELLAQLQRYVILNDDAAVAISLWIMFCWAHEIATYSPLLVATSAEPDSGKTTLLDVIGFLTPRPYSAVEVTATNIYRIVDHLHPTLIVDEADQLFHRKPALAEVFNAGWTRGAKIPRMVRGGEIHQFDVFCPKVVGMIGLNLPPQTISRAIVCKLWPKLPDERIDDFHHVDDDEFVALRRKAMRWASDNAVALKDAEPIMSGFNNRLRMNWRLLMAIADLAGSTWPKQARTAALKLLHKRHRQSEGRRLLAVFQKMFGKRAMLTSKEVVKQLIADQDDEWADFRGRGPITERQVSLLLDPYDIHPDVIHPPGRPSARGYKAEWFAQVFARLLLDNRTSVRKSRGKR